MGCVRARCAVTWLIAIQTLGLLSGPAHCVDAATQAVRARSFFSANKGVVSPSSAAPTRLDLGAVRNLLVPPTVDQSGRVHKPVFTGKSGAGSSTSRIAGVPGQGDLTDCLKEPAPQLTVPGFEDYSKQFRSGIIKLFLRNRATLDLTDLCSGSLIHPQVVLTAAHCVYDTTGKYFYLNATHTIQAYAKLNGASETDDFISAEASDAVVFSGYTLSASFDVVLRSGNDVALLILAQPLVNVYRFSWTKALTTPELRTLVGYPAVTQNGLVQVSDISTSNTVKFGTACTAPRLTFRISSTAICEDMQAEPGHSGSPLFNMYSGRVVGVVSALVNSGCGLFVNPVVERFNVNTLLGLIGCRITTRKIGATGPIVYSVRSCVLV